MKSEQEIIENNKKAFLLLKEKGLVFRDIQNVKSAFVAFAQLNDPNIETVRGHSTNELFYKNKLVKTYGFSSEPEASFAGAIAKYAPELSPEKVCKVLSIVNSLIGKETEYKF